ncbi:unnamed protein product [Ilex paraguariensis]|uniref:N-acetyltransferase domain-containing protein n=1 Tax=Ilex paraguariensis TaxID=185542 RepID=A0ABC8R3C4_9AQUA
MKFSQEWNLNGKPIWSCGGRILMATIGMHRPGFLKTSCYGMRNRHNFHRISAFWTMTMNSKSSQKREYEEFSIKLREHFVSEMETLCPSNLQFDRLQQLDQDLIPQNKIEFGQFVVRKAADEEELWAAAWLRAESHWEDRKNDRYVDSFKRKFAEQEFTALRRRCKAQLGHKCTCIVTIKEEERNVKHTVLKNVFGTLDLIIQQLLDEETFHGEQVKSPLFCSTNGKGNNKYGYIANLCVAKSARRLGIASSMVRFAIITAKTNGAEQVFVHVHRYNRPAQELYRKIGFEVVEMASPQLSEEQTYLLRFRA